MLETPARFNRFESWKVLAHAQKIRQIVGGGIPAPVEWVIYPSNVCGYRCLHCIMAREQVDHKNTLPKETMAKIPEDAVRMGIRCVIFSGGGDPLLNHWTEQTAVSLKLRGIKVGLNNQGYITFDPRSFDFVRYSVDAATQGTYEKIHRVDGWKKVNDNIKRHARLRAEGVQSEMGLAFLITPLNAHETEAFCEWAQQFAPDFVHIRPAYLDAGYLDEKYPGGGKAMKEQVIPSLKETAARLQEKYKNVYFRIDKFEGFWTPKQYTKCRATPLMAVTSGDGAFLVCQDRGISKDEEYLRWGNYNTQTFEEIWWSPDHEKVLASIDLPRCPRCVENAYNEVIEHCFVKDNLRLDLL